MCSMKVAICGTHGSGKTTLLHRVVSDLNAQDVRAVLVPEAARQSPFLLMGRRSIESQVHMFVSHCEAELIHGLMPCEVLLSDRTSLDMIAYTSVFFPEERGAINAMKAFSKWYMARYALVFKTTGAYPQPRPSDGKGTEWRDLQTVADRSITALLHEQYANFVALPADFQEAREMVISQVTKHVMDSRSVIDRGASQ